MQPVKSLPPGYVNAGSVSLANKADLKAMQVWSFVLPLPVILLIALVLWAVGGAGGSGSFTMSSLRDLWQILAALLLVTVVMLVVHEGLHGLVFWVVTGAAPKFEFKGYYASASPGEWYLPRRPFMLATLLPLAAITAVSLALLPFVGAIARALLILLAVFNASGSAGDFVVAQRLAKYADDTLIKDSGAEVTFYAPAKKEN